MHKLLIYREKELVRELDLEKESYTLGRDPHCDLSLEGNFISRRHARICRIETGWMIEDLKSTNGTLIAGERISRKKLEGGEEIRIGPFRINFLAPPPPVEPTRVAPPEETTDKTEGRDKVPEKPGEVLNGKPGLLLLGPEGLRRFFPLPENPGARVSLPGISAEMVREDKNIILRFPSKTNRPEMVVKPGWQNLPSGFSIRRIEPGEIVSLASPGAQDKSGFKIKPIALFIPLLLAGILYLVFSPLPFTKSSSAPAPAPPRNKIESPPATGTETPSPTLPPPDQNLGLGPSPESRKTPPPLPPPPVMLPPGPGPTRPRSEPPEVVMPSEPLTPEESRPASPDRLAKGFQAYSEGNLGQAREEWASLAVRIPPAEPDRERALRLAQLAGKLRSELLLEQEAEKQKNLQAARFHFESARALDGEINPGGKSRVLKEAREGLARLISLEGEDAFRQGDFPAAFLRFNEALRFSPDLAPARNGLDRLADQAQILFREAYNLESANWEEASKKYRLILQIIPAGQEYYRKAFRRLELLK